jgi:hypothetical protein
VSESVVEQGEKDPGEGLTKHEVMVPVRRYAGTIRIFYFLNCIPTVDYFMKLVSFEKFGRNIPCQYLYLEGHQVVYLCNCGPRASSAGLLARKLTVLWDSPFEGLIPAWRWPGWARGAT